MTNKERLEKLEQAKKLLTEVEFSYPNGSTERHLLYRLRLNTWGPVSELSVLVDELYNKIVLENKIEHKDENEYYIYLRIWLTYQVAYAEAIKTAPYNNGLKAGADAVFAAYGRSLSSFRPLSDQQESYSLWSHAKMESIRLYNIYGPDILNNIYVDKGR